MALYAALTVGNRSVGTVVVENEGQIDPDLDLWEYEYHLIQLGVVVDACPHGTVEHIRSEGAWRLLQRVLDDALGPAPARTVRQNGQNDGGETPREPDPTNLH